jgi:hypothetical protein
VAARLNLSVEDDIPAKLSELAGGERKRGEFVTRLVRQLHEESRSVQTGVNLEGLRLQVLGLAGQVRSLEGRIIKLERTLAAMIAERER